MYDILDWLTTTMTIIWWSQNLGRHCLNEVSRGSSVSTVSGYGLDDRAVYVRFLAEVKGFFL
jgi:hypothetical protein